MDTMIRKSISAARARGPVEVERAKQQERNVGTGGFARAVRAAPLKLCWTESQMNMFQNFMARARGPVEVFPRWLESPHA